MNSPEHENLERELQRHRPAQPSAELMTRLIAARPPSPHTGPRRIAMGSAWVRLQRLFVPATAALLLSFVGWRWLATSDSNSQKLPITVDPAVKADEVQLDRELVRSFDTVARLPGGEPVRFRCRTWRDELIVRDKSGGLVIDQRTPRVEVVPVRFETY